MGGLRDMLRKAFGRDPEAALAEFKEKLHLQINDFKDNPETRTQLRRMLQSVVTPLRQFNLFVVNPALNNNERLKAMAKRYGVNKIELKRMLKTSLELEEKLQKYFKDSDEIDQLVLTLRKVVNVLDEDVVTGFIDAMDYNIDYGKIEKAYLDYQHNLQKAYNAEGLNRDLQGLIGQVLNNLKGAFNNTQKPVKTKASDRQADARMLEPELQILYDRYRDEGFTHDEAMRVVGEKRDLDGLPEELMEAYRSQRREGQDHDEALAYARVLAAKHEARKKAKQTEEAVDAAETGQDHPESSDSPEAQGSDASQPE